MTSTTHLRGRGRRGRRPATGFDWRSRYRTAPFISIRQTGWDAFRAQAECWGGVELAIDPATLKILTSFAEPATAADVYAALKPTIDVARVEFASVLAKMLEAGLLGLDGLLHTRLVPKAVDKVRLGRPSDGGYVVPARFAEHVDGLLAFGVGDDLSFENDFVDHHPGRALAFDHTVERPPYRRPRVELVRKGVAPRPSADMVTLTQVVLEGPFRRPMIKMDIEGAEWRVLAACNAEVFRRVPIIVFELHGMLANTPLQNDVVTRLLGVYEPVHVHANNIGAALKLDGRAYPEWLEVTFLHRELLPAPVVDLGRFPTAHDYPNGSGRDDVEVGWWRPTRPRPSTG